MKTATVIVACTLLLAAAWQPAHAQDRTDLLDIPGTSFVGDSPNGLSGQDYAYIIVDDTPLGSYAARRESFRVAHENAPGDSVTFWLYEPDKVTRKSDGAKLIQKDQLWVKTFLVFAPPPSSSNSFSAYGFVTGCKGSTNVKKDTLVKWAFSCKNGEDVLDQLGVTNPDVRTAILGTFGNKLAAKNTGTLP